MKRIIIGCDGTGNEYGENNTNVVINYELTHKSDDQTVFYDPGVGTGGWEYSEKTGGLKAVSDLATGVGLQNNVEDAYRFLMWNYQKGDEIFLFGFSRGAFTARSLAGMLHKCGLLGSEHRNLVEYAGKLYNTKGNAEVVEGFKETFCQPCPVHFIGVWDTVDSRILNAGKRWADATLNPEVKFAYHAIAIDERRKDFPSCAWDESQVAAGQTMEQLWFAGVHCDVGGWYDERGLSNIALQWMLKKANDCGADIDMPRLVAHYPADPLGDIHESYKGFWKFRGSRRRKMPDNARIHVSVKQRIEAGGYKPVNLPDSPIYVE